MQRKCPLLTQSGHRPLGQHALSDGRIEPLLCVYMNVGPDLRRRDFLGLVGGLLVAGMNSARAQQGSRRIEVLMGAAETSSSRDWVAAFLRRLDELGWRDGTNLVVKVQWWNDRLEQMRTRAAELISRSPDVAVTYTNLALEVLKPIAGSVPIVFCGVGDPVGSGFVASLARPGGNITGLAALQTEFTGKALEMLTQVAPQVKKIGVLWTPTAPHSPVS